MRSVHERREQVHERARKVEGRSSKISRSSRFLWNVSVRTFLRIYPQRYRNSVTQLESSRIRIIERDTISISRSNRSRTKPPPRFNLRGSWMCVTESWSLLWDLAWFVETEHEGESNGRKAVLMENCVSNQEGIVATIETIDIPPEIWGYESKFANVCSADRAKTGYRSGGIFYEGCAPPLQILAYSTRRLKNVYSIIGATSSRALF